jgi:hypothetical protein
MYLSKFAVYDTVDEVFAMTAVVCEEAENAYEGRQKSLGCRLEKSNRWLARDVDLFVCRQEEFDLVY